MTEVEFRRDLPVDHCYRDGYVHSDVVRTFDGWDGRCWMGESTQLDHPRPLSVVIGQVMVPAIKDLIGEDSYVGPWADWQLDLVKAFVSKLQQLIDHEQDRKTRNRPETLAGTGPAPRATHTPSSEGGGHHER